MFFKRAVEGTVARGEMVGQLLWSGPRSVFTILPRGEMLGQLLGSGPRSVFTILQVGRNGSGTGLPLMICGVIYHDIFLWYCGKECDTLYCGSME